MKKRRTRGPRTVNKLRRKEPSCERLPRSRAPPLRRYNRTSTRRSRRCSRRFRSSDWPDLTRSARHKMLASSRFRRDRSDKKRLTRALS